MNLLRTCLGGGYFYILYSVETICCKTVIKCLMLVQHRLMATPNVDIQRQLVTLVHLLTKHLLLNCKMVSIARTISPVGYSECGYTRGS